MRIQKLAKNFLNLKTSEFFTITKKIAPLSDKNFYKSGTEAKNYFQR